MGYSPVLPTGRAPAGMLGWLWLLWVVLSASRSIYTANK